MRLGLVKEANDGFVADTVMLENMVRIKRTVIPIWSILVIFFATSVVLLLSLERPSGPITHSYLFSLIVIVVALIVSISQTLSSMSKGV